MTVYNVSIYSSQQIQPSTTYICPITIEYNKTVYDYLKKLLEKNPLAQWCSYVYNNKSLGFDHSPNLNIFKLFGSNLSPIVHELPIINPVNPFKRLYWVIYIYENKLSNIENLDGEEPINRNSIGTWNTWGKLDNKINKEDDNRPDYLVILEQSKHKYAYNKFQLRKLIKKSNKTVTVPHNNTVIDTCVLKNQLEKCFHHIMPIINIDLSTK